MSEFKSNDANEKPQEYQNLLGKISETYTIGQVKAVQAVNIQLLESY
ncbi:hypothetical protein M3O96_00955 [Aquiflexum sp. TKW24L]|nr:hypothetical protein [Aquiflexum sp. TKW24L]MCL6257637.1 hypothetical protein [Aquiflexum sp. TKW24L]